MEEKKTERKREKKQMKQFEVKTIDLPGSKNAFSKIDIYSTVFTGERQRREERGRMISQERVVRMKMVKKRERDDDEQGWQ